MHLPTKSIERALAKRGAKWIAAVDEAGRGSWAGPVVAGAVLFDARFFHSRSRALARTGPAKLSTLVIPNRSVEYYKDFAFLRDSKLMTARQRETYYYALGSHGGIHHAVGVVNEKTIDEVNIHHATLLAMRRAIGSLPHKPDAILIDGIFPIPNACYSQQCFPHGDRRIFSIAAASIIAKVTRDRIMAAYAAQYPTYGFERHKGYGTKFHHAQLALHGPSPIHRMSYKPVAGSV